jgi:hypothetical protein
MKLLKRLLLLLAVLLAMLLVLLAIGYRQLRKSPDFYHPYVWDDTRRALINQQAADKLLAARQFAQHAHFDPILAETARRHGSTLPAEPPPPPLTLQFSEEELNALLIHNSETFQAVKDQYEQYFTNPGIFLHGGRIILAAQVKDLGSILSLHFAPTLDHNGNLQLPLSQALLGRLPMPQVLMNKQLDRVRSALAAKLPAWQRSARLDSHGGANPDAAKAAAARLLLGALSNQPADPVLFIPVNDKGTSTPLRITQFQVQNNTLTLTVEPMTEPQRREMFNKITRP